MNFLTELQNDIYEGKDILKILRKSYTISKELELNDFNKWIDLELNGYHDKDYTIPEYRKISSELRCHTKQFTHSGIWDIPDTRIYDLPEEFMETLSNYYLPNSIPEIIKVCKDNKAIQIPFDSTFENSLRKFLIKYNHDKSIKYQFLEIYRYCPVNQIESIIDYVKNTILDWTSELKNKGISGEEYSFTDVEREKANNINYNLTILNNVYKIENNITIDETSFKTVVSANLNAIREILKENKIETKINNKIIDNITLMESELDKKQPDLNILSEKGLLIKELIKEISIAVVANLISNQITTTLLYIMHFSI